MDANTKPAGSASTWFSGWRWRHLWPAVLVALALASTGARISAATIEPGATFPDLAGASLEGDLPDLSAAPVVIVDFWASWCAPCKQSFPVFDELQRTYASRGVVIIAVSVDRRARDMTAFLARNPVAFTVVRDAAQQLVAEVGVPTMPTSFVLDRHRVVRFVHRGFHGERSRLEYVSQIDALLSEAP